MIRLFIPTILIILLLTSCSHSERSYYNDETLKSECEVVNNKIEGTYKEYYKSTGELKCMAFYLDGQLEGQKKTFYRNGKIKSIENFKGNQLKGDCIYYNNFGNIDTIKNYILIDPSFYKGVNSQKFYKLIYEVFSDSIKGKKSHLNSLLIMDKDGKVVRKKSHYFEVAIKKDTIDLNDSLYAVLVFKYRRNGEKTKFRVIQFANKEMDLYNVYDSDYENVFFQDKPVKRGINYVRGWIEEYTPYGFDTLRNVLFFEKKYFVR